MTNYRVTQKEMVIAAINHMPGCTLRDICEALELTTSNAGKLLRLLTKEGIVVKSNEDRDPGYCSGQLKLATALEFFQYRFSDSFGGNPPL